MDTTMRPSPGGPAVFLSAAEHSADRYGAGLIHALRRACPGASFTGIAGPAMAQAGCCPLKDLTSRSAMLMGAVGAVGQGFRALMRADDYFSRHRVDVVVVIDSPMLNLPLARLARQHGLPVLYYVAPQLWAWGAYRMGKLRSRVDRLAVILPFEEPFFRSHGIDAEFVGHPLFERLAEEQPDPAAVARIRAHGSPVVAMLPGSRRHVVREVLPGQVEVAQAVRVRFPRAAFVASAATPETASITRSLTQGRGFRVDVHEGRPTDILAAADLALVASGTATLEVAYRRVPMVVMYNSPRWGYRLVGRWLISTRYLSLVNIIAGHELVPEFMPYYRSTAPIARAVIDLLSDPDRRRALSAALGDLIQPLALEGVADRVASMTLELAGAQG